MKVAELKIPITYTDSKIRLIEVDLT